MSGLFMSGKQEPEAMQHDCRLLQSSDASTERYNWITEMSIQRTTVADDYRPRRVWRFAPRDRILSIE